MGDEERGSGMKEQVGDVSSGRSMTGMMGSREVPTTEYRVGKYLDALRQSKRDFTSRYLVALSVQCTATLIWCMYQTIKLRRG